MLYTRPSNLLLNYSPSISENNIEYETRTSKDYSKRSHYIVYHLKRKSVWMYGIHCKPIIRYTIWKKWEDKYKLRLILVIVLSQNKYYSNMWNKWEGVLFALQFFYALHGISSLWLLSHGFELYNYIITL